MPLSELSEEFQKDLGAARTAYLTEMISLAHLTPEEARALSDYATAQDEPPEDEGDEEDHSTPKLTDEEWEFVLGVNDGS